MFNAAPQNFTASTNDEFDAFARAAAAAERTATDDDIADVAAAPPVRRAPKYEVDGGRMFFNKVDPKTGIAIAIPLCDGVIEIAERLTYADGVERELWYKMKGTTHDGRILPYATIRATELDRFTTWKAAAWGNELPLAAGMSVRDALREAIETLSVPADRELRLHTGWHVPDGEDEMDRVYLHAGGMVGAACVQADLEGALEKFRLPAEAAVKEDGRAAVRASMKFLEMAAPEIVLPLFAATYLAPLSSILRPDFAVWLVGASGSFKSEACAIAQGHFGPFDRKTLPGSWTSTENALESLLFRAKDALIVVDDYAPAAHNRITLRAKAERVLRSIGNGASRARLNANLEVRPERPPRGMVLCTGEDMPDGASVIARVVRVDMKRADVDLATLTALQDRRDQLPVAMHLYVTWLKLHYRHLASDLPKRLALLRREYIQAEGHARQPEALAMLEAAFETFLRFAKTADVISEADIADRLTACRATLMRVGERNHVEAHDSDPADVFVETVRAMWDGGTVNLVDRKSKYVLHGDKGHAPIGWRDMPEREGDTSGSIYLQPELAYREVVRFLSDSGTSLGASKRMIAKLLHARGYLVAPDYETEKRLDTQLRIGGVSRRTWQIPRALIEPPAPRPVAVSPADPSYDDILDDLPPARVGRR